MGDALMAGTHSCLRQAGKYRSRMVRFLKDLVAIPGFSGSEGPVINRIRQELESVGGFDRIWTDPMGNLLARIGRLSKSKKLLAVDAHVDTVEVGDRSEWKRDPFKAVVADGKVWGRGAGDQRGAIPAMVYAGAIMRDLGISADDYCLLFTFTVMEEDCDGLCWQYIINEDGIRPDAVVVTDSTDCRVLRGQRGRMEIGITCKGKSCHGSMPHKGVNAIYRVSRIAGEIERLNDRLADDPFLGKGTVTVSYVDCKTPSRCAVPGEAYLHLDRRLTIGETRRSALAEVRKAVKRAGVPATIEVPRYRKPSYTGLVYETDHYFPTWCEPEDARQVRAASETYRTLFGRKPRVGRWTFSTNAVSIAGMHGIPCVGFGPAPEKVAHTVNDSVPIDHLVKAAAFYATFGQSYCSM